VDPAQPEVTLGQLNKTRKHTLELAYRYIMHELQHLQARRTRDRNPERRMMRRSRR